MLGSDSNSLITGLLVWLREALVAGLHKVRVALDWMPRTVSGFLRGSRSRLLPPVMHNQKTMAILWNPESWSQRLAELEAQSGDLKEAPLRRDVRSLGMLLGDVLREQAGDELFSEVEALRQGTIRRRDAEARGRDEEA